MSETSLMREFMYRAAREVPDARIFRRNVAFIKTDERAFRAGLKGQADLVVYVKGGHVIEIELKSRRGKLSSEQENWRNWCRSFGVPWLHLQALQNETTEQTVERWVREFRALVLRTG
jgi:hypothetical protein